MASSTEHRLVRPEHGIHENYREFIKERFGEAYYRALSKSLQADITACTSNIVEFGPGGDEVLSLLLKHRQADAHITLIEQDSRILRQLRAQKQPNVEIFDDRQTSHIADQSIELAIIQNPNRKLILPEGAVQLKRIVDANGKIVVLRDWEVDPDQVKNANYLSYRDSWPETNQALNLVQQRVSQQFEAYSFPAILQKLLTRNSVADAKINDIYSAIQGHLAEWAATEYAYEKAGLHVDSMEYVVGEDTIALSELKSIDPALDENFGYLLLSLGGARMLIQDDSVSPGFIHRVYAIQKITFMGN